MIALTAVSARSGGGFRRAASVLDGVSLRWQRGVLVVLGSAADGTTALLEVLAGEVRAKRGQVSVASTRVVHVRTEPALPDGLRVDEIGALEASLRPWHPGRTLAERLGVLGVTHLAERPAKSLSRGEARAVQLAFGLTTGADVLLLDEPLAGLEPPAAARFAEALRVAAERSCVVVTTASVREASRLADQVLVLTQGKIGEAAADALHRGSAARLVVVLASDPAPFEAALAGAAGVVGVESASYRGGPGAGRIDAGTSAVTVAGTDPLAVASAIMKAASSSAAEVVAIEPEPATIERVRAALAAPAAPAPEVAS